MPDFTVTTGGPTYTDVETVRGCRVRRGEDRPATGTWQGLAADDPRHDDGNHVRLTVDGVDMVGVVTSSTERDGLLTFGFVVVDPDRTFAFTDPDSFSLEAIGRKMAADEQEGTPE